MGTCLHAFIEIAQPRYSYTGEKITEVPGEVHWWQLATLEFNKDYHLMGMLYQNNNVKDLWPDDICSEITENQARDDFEVKQWCTAEDYINFISCGDNKGERFSPIAEALKVFLMKVQKDADWIRGLRILFHRT